VRSRMTAAQLSEIISTPGFAIGDQAPKIRPRISDGDQDQSIIMSARIEHN